MTKASGRAGRSRRRVTHLILDAEGLSQGAVRGTEARSTINATRRAGKEIRVSAVTLTEVLRGRPRDARVHALLKLCLVKPVTGEVGRAAGSYSAAAGATTRWTRSSR